jgi:hypothetical protein
MHPGQAKVTGSSGHRGAAETCGPRELANLRRPPFPGAFTAKLMRRFSSLTASSDLFWIREDN